MKGEVGLDGIAIIVNDMLVINEDTLNEALNISAKVEVKFVFLQAKTSDRFDGDEMGTFFYGVKSFFFTNGTEAKNKR
ncbi:hypothetical protein [Cohnella rhizosphaerae]|uniref:Uncharacterized protein n=1 Tax=Cohnella rhizosphaerae TaxID=1457232 RepID=A0A9X4KQR8_9BACL|nr:hypothetical protein [Cohnella rhizosphaerae]MDG0809057.1 hypothetical protein [Cohnella rhizosphaerae]